MEIGSRPMRGTPPPTQTLSPDLSDLMSRADRGLLNMVREDVFGWFARSLVIRGAPSALS